MAKQYIENKSKNIFNPTPKKHNDGKMGKKFLLTNQKVFNPANPVKKNRY